ncbi:MAG: Ig-like domain-containing protein [Sedimentisphaerales bacterium]|nr:Ig-like domain-containing protein [Sedimentisphaerales bacterium]
MFRKLTSRSIYCILAVIIFGLGQNSTVRAADMMITNLFPDNNDVNVCADTKLWITFDAAPIMSTDSNMHLQICQVSDDSVVYQLDLQELPTNYYGPIGTGWPYKISLPEVTLNYQPFDVVGNVLEIYPSTSLDYNTEYYVKMTAGFCSDANGNTCPDINDNTTWRFTTKPAAPAADHDYTVALDGSGDFCTMQGAVDAVANYDSTRTLIRIKNGNYRGVVYIPSYKLNITWLGQDRDETVVYAYNREIFNPGSDARMVVRSYPDGFRMYNLTLHNTAPDNSGQAETIKHSNIYSIVENCKFKSYQDTLCLNGHMYMKDCYIEGDTDYIWGYGTVYFDQCELRYLSSGSHLTQPRTANGAKGFFFVDCVMTASGGVANCDFGRLFNGYGYAQVVLIDCIMPSSLIVPVGWLQNTLTDLSNVRLWEYKSRDPSGSLIDVSGRLEASVQLSDAEAITWRDVNNVFNSWNPKVPAEAPSCSWQPQPADGATDIISAELAWAAGAGVTSHMVYFGETNPPAFVEEITELSYVVTQIMDANTTYYWRIDEKNSAGTTTGDVWSFTTSSILDTTPPSPNPLVWAIEPNSTSTDTITMTATTATDESGVEYYFTNVTDSNHDSGWQNSEEYTDTGLDNDTTYTYKVKARDKSIRHNATADSNEASAATLRYICGEPLIPDLDGDCQVHWDDYIIFADGWMVSRVKTEDINNGTFDTELDPWALVDAEGVQGTMTVTFDGSYGQPAGSALIQADTTGTAVNHHRFYQVIPVIVGDRYKFSGQWSGALYDPNSTTRRNWAEVFVGFSPDDTPSEWGTIMYKKRFISVGSSSNVNFDPNSDGTWEWEEITDSPEAGPADGLFVASQPYMVVSFNLGGNSNGGASYINIDNISIAECPMTADLNGDCELDMADLEEVAEQWMVCNRTPIEECWQ